MARARRPRGRAAPARRGRTGGTRATGRPGPGRARGQRGRPPGFLVTWPDVPPTRPHADGSATAKLHANLRAVVAVRDSENVEGPALTFARAAWQDLTSELAHRACPEDPTAPCLT
ncbi:DUF397 domain-containing protein [Actinocorallia herbida]|uniref:DUF397 domain-containing protein n=1 Tax=Actinocorallia herbida TaxID=58109 RepID=UPI0024830B85|nr:DUF397 domain-containing protein [Actinocorallia herbida]